MYAQHVICSFYHIYIYTEWLNIMKKKIPLEFFSKNFNFLLLSLAVLYSFKCYRLLNIDMYLRYIYIICKYIYRLHIQVILEGIWYTSTQHLCCWPSLSISINKKGQAWKIGLEKLCSIYMFFKFTYIKLDTQLEIIEDQKYFRSLFLSQLSTRLCFIVHIGIVEVHKLSAFYKYLKQYGLQIRKYKRIVERNT